jgi:antitoxin CcdA
MPAPRAKATPKKPTNVSIDAELLAKAREQGINLSATLERALAVALNKTERDHWLGENRGAMDAYNALVEKDGVFSDGLRSF